jgi:hypothetical protein
MSQDAKGLSPFAGGLGIPDAWCTTVVAYGPAEATVTGRRINRAATAAAAGKPFLIAYLPRIALEALRSSAWGFAVSRRLLSMPDSYSRPVRLASTPPRARARSKARGWYRYGGSGIRQVFVFGG